MTSSQQNQDFDGVNDSVMTRTMKGTINFWSRSAEGLYGWKQVEAVGKVSHDLLQTQFPKPLDEIEAELIQKGRWEGKLVHTTRDGIRLGVQSRWTMDSDRESGKVIEINVPSTGSETDPESRTAGYNVEIERQERLPTSRSAKPEELVAKFADGALVGGGVLCLLVLSYLAYYYDWTGQRSLTSSVVEFVYFALPGMLAIALLACLGLRASHRINVVLCLCSVAFALYATEALITLWLSLPSVKTSQDIERRIQAAAIQGVKYDRRTKREVVNDFRERGIDAIPSLFPEELLKKQSDGAMKSAITINGVEVLPLASIANKLNVVCNEGGQFLTYQSDQHGFNNPQRVWHMPIEIVAVGDSFTQGWCVDPESNFVSVIRRGYPGTLNLGIEGDGPLTMLATIKEYAEFVKPKVVLWFYFEDNDLEELRNERKNSILTQYLATKEFSQGLFNRQAEIDWALAGYLENISEKNAWSINLKEIWERVIDTDEMPNRLIAFVKLQKLQQRLGFVYGRYETSSQEVFVVPRSEHVPEIELLFNVLLQAKELVGEWGGSLYFVYLPELYFYARQERRDPNRSAVLQTANKAGLPVIDMLPIFMAHKDPLSLFPLRLGGHYNEEGNRLVAEQVLRALSSTKNAD
jgi:lysophospholipase L1-like esterase